MPVRGSGLTTRRNVLEAAAELVEREGVAKLTLDAVAERAGLSKGGILHHFATKDSLVSAMIEDLVAQFEADLTKHMAGEQGPGSFARAFLRACLDPEGALTRTVRLSAGIVAAVATNSQLLAPLRRRYDYWRKRLEDDGIDPAIAELVRSAADGLWFAGVLGLALPSVALRKRLFAKLIEMTYAT
jgi:AcrR family transcriptional regulator